MTTELDISRLANRLKATYPKEHTAITFNLDSYTSGRQKWEWNAYRGDMPGTKGVSPLMPTLAELEDWLNNNWLKDDPRAE